jgi:hypothetical protein
VRKKIDVQRLKMRQCWEKPFIIVNFNKKIGGYRLVGANGVLLNAKVPIDQFKVILYFDHSKHNGNFFKIKKIFKH